MIKQRREDSGVEIVTLDRPDKRNAMTPEMFIELRRVISDSSGRSAIVLGGEGPVFCGGFDLKLCLDVPGTMRTLLTELSALVMQLRRLDVPVVVAAHGAALAGGCAILGGADFVVTNDDAKLGYPVVRLGVSPAVSAPFLRQMIGGGRCRPRLLDTELISGTDAARIGLVGESVRDATEVLPRAIEVARTMAAKPGNAFRVTKRWLDEIDDDPSMSGVLVGPRGMEEQAEAALNASLSIEGHAEERERLARMFRKE